MSSGTTKIAVTVPTLVFEVLEQEREKLAVSRSNIVTKALIQYLKMHCPTCGGIYSGDKLAIPDEGDL